MILVKNEKKYWDFIHSLRNDPKLKKGFIQQQDIDIKDHYSYMEKNGDHYYVCLANGSPVGFVGQVDGDIRLAVAEYCHGKGVGTYMVKQLMKSYPNSHAKVKIDNKPSLNVFLKNGFEVKEQDDNFYYLVK